MPEWLKPYLSRIAPESSRRLIALVAAGTLCASDAALTAAVLWQVIAHRAVDPQLVLGLGAVTATLATLAGAIYRKKEAPDARP